MTPDIEYEGQPLALGMRDLADLSESGSGGGWQSLDRVVSGYAEWISRKRLEVDTLNEYLRPVARKHLERCDHCLERITAGIRLLRADRMVLQAFRLANLAMILQQISSKKLTKRELHWDDAAKRVGPSGMFMSPWQIYSDHAEGERIGVWRAFQIAFLLMSLDGVASPESKDREVVDLIWFPTGGGKTEAYLGVVAFLLLHERMLMAASEQPVRRDGTNVLMR
jgi:hypothetical protein